MSPPAHVADIAPPSNTASYSAVVDRVAPAVVTVRVEKHAAAPRTALPESFRDFFGPQSQDDPRGRREGGLGSGVIFRTDGHILTNHHVIDGADQIRVDLADGRSLPAKLVGIDAASDLAVLKIEARDLPTAAFGDSDRMKVGDVVLAFGNPLGVGQTVTMGIVSAKGRATGVGDGSYEDFLQTDAPINQGNSGGALVNLQGELVGHQRPDPVALGRQHRPRLRDPVGDGSRGHRPADPGRRRPPLEAGCHRPARDAGTGRESRPGRRAGRAGERRRARKSGRARGAAAG